MSVLAVCLVLCLAAAVLLVFLRASTDWMRADRARMKVESDRRMQEYEQRHGPAARAVAEAWIEAHVNMPWWRRWWARCGGLLRYGRTS